MIIDHVALALARLTEQFQDSPKLKALLSAIVSPLNSVESDLEDTKTKRWVDTAEGFQLDMIGSLVRETRGGRNDEDYREAIRFRIFVNISEGTPNDVCHALRFITKADVVQYFETYPATFLIYSDGYDASARTPDIMQDLSPAAVTGVDVAVSFGEEPLRLSSDVNDSELAGVSLDVLHCINGKRLLTLSGKKLRLRSGFTTYKTRHSLAGLFEKKS